MPGTEEAPSFFPSPPPNPLPLRHSSAAFKTKPRSRSCFFSFRHPTDCKFQGSLQSTSQIPAGLPCLFLDSCDSPSSSQPILSWASQHQLSAATKATSQSASQTEHRSALLPVVSPSALSTGRPPPFPAWTASHTATFSQPS